TLACLLFAASAFAIPGAAGRDLTYQLDGSRNGGWGSTNTSLTTPGPLIEVEVGDNVTLNLTSLDGLSHRWFIDYNNNSAADASEPKSPNFANQVLWNFTVSNVTGTFAYRSDRTAGPGDDLAKMWGNITIRTAGSSAGGLGGNLLLIGIVLVIVAVIAIGPVACRRAPPPRPPSTQRGRPPCVPSRHSRCPPTRTSSSSAGWRRVSRNACASSASPCSGATRRNRRSSRSRGRPSDAYGRTGSSCGPARSPAT